MHMGSNDISGTDFYLAKMCFLIKLQDKIGTGSFRQGRKIYSWEERNIYSWEALSKRAKASSWHTNLIPWVN